MGKTALAYLRVSSRGQVEGDGFPRQRKAIAAYCKSNRLELVGEYLDKGVSGAKCLAERPGLLELVARVASNGVRLVLVEKADRLARDVVVSELILRELRTAGVQVIEAESGTDITAGDADNPSSKLIRQMLGVIAEFEKDAIVVKLRAARIRTRKATGSCEGRKPFGHRDGELETLATIRKLRRKSRGKPTHGWVAISKHLNETGRSTRSGKPWSADLVRKLATR